MLLALPSRRTVPLASVNVIVRSAVGLVNATVVSLPSSPEPSTVNPESLRCIPVMIGLVIVLLVSVLVVAEKYVSSKSTSR